MIKKLFIFIALITSAKNEAQTAGENLTDSIIIITDNDSASLTDPLLRNLSEDSAKALKSDKAFAYMRYIDSSFRNKKEPEANNQRNELEKSKSIFDNQGLRTLYWMVAILGVTIIIWRMFIGSNAIFLANKKTKPVTGKPNIEKEVPTDDEMEIEIAVRNKNYRLATRHLYILTIKRMGEKKYISTTPQKTNFQYVQEIKSEEVRKNFARLTLHYQYAWFGNFPLTENQFHSIQTGFNSFLRSI